MNIDNKKDHILELIKSSKSIGILCGDKMSDAVASGIAFAIYIEEMYKKPVKVVYPFDLTKINLELLEYRKIETELGPKTLEVKLNLEGTEIETVDYEKKDDILVLKISPIGSEFDKKKIEYEVVGKAFDLVISIGSKNLQEYGKFYYDNKSDLDKVDTINIDNTMNNDNFGKINILNPTSKKISAMVLSKLVEMGYTLSEDVAKVLLIGLKD